MIMYEKLKEFTAKENIILGVGSAEPFYELKEYLKEGSVPFVNYSTEERTEPKLIMEDAKSIVAIGLSYNRVYKRINDGRIRGNMSAGAVGTDYHIVVKNILERLRNYVIPNNKAVIFSDTGPLSDRDVAIRCRLGIRGRNGSVINSEIGGMFFIGYMITDVPLEKWQWKGYNKISCSGCDACVRACPNNALSEGRCDYKKCISYITQKKGVLSNSEYKSIGKQIYGCDVCQRVCPYNKKSAEICESEYAFPDIERLMNMTNREFNEVYGKTAAGWRGKRTLQRNALAVVGNTGDEKGLCIAEKFCKSNCEDIRSAALYAVKSIKEK